MRIAVVGAGGFAREVKWLIGEVGREAGLEFAGFIVSDPSQLSDRDSRDEVLGGLDWPERFPGSVDGLAIGIGSPAARLRLGRELAGRYPALEWPPLVHPSVCIDRPTAGIGRGTILAAGVMATVNVEVQEFAMVNLACTLGHECVIGRGSVLNPTVNVSGGVRLGEGVLVGTGAQILQYVTLGDGVTVGAGAVVTKSWQDEVTLVGVPARPVGK